jgi:hypothetical protein
MFLQSLVESSYLEKKIKAGNNILNKAFSFLLQPEYKLPRCPVNGVHVQNQNQPTTDTQRRCL